MGPMAAIEDQRMGSERFLAVARGRDRLAKLTIPLQRRHAKAIDLADQLGQSEATGPAAHEALAPPPTPDWLKARNGD